MDPQEVSKQFAQFAPPAQEEYIPVPDPEFSAKSVPTTSPEAMMTGLYKLLEILAAREARLEAKEQEQIEAFRKRDEQVRRNNKDWNRNILLTQAKCHHRKGFWKHGPGPLTVDYAVYMHTFINMKREIKCRICKMTWRPEDTKEFLVISGQNIPNHTGIGWEDAVNGKISALAMTAQSTDKPSASEAPLYGQLPDEVTSLLNGRPPDFIAQLLSSPEAKAFLERTAKQK
jgi:hypothetical protein